MNDAWHFLALAAEFVPGDMRGFLVEGRDILVCQSKQGWFALDNVCTHAYARLSEGRLRGCRLICPLHGASFDVRDGRVLGLPATAPLHVHRLRIENGRVEVAFGA
jgi:3-phenylpropionate/trans-cinnamate dioxygenase ferredoxin subunit